MLYGSCRECKHLNDCYPMPKDSNQWASDLYNALLAFRNRDLCVNNDKVDWEQKEL